MPEWNAETRRQLEAFGEDIPPARPLIAAALGEIKRQDQAWRDVADRLRAGTLHRVECSANHNKPTGGDGCICNHLKVPLWRAEQRIKELEEERDAAYMAGHAGGIEDALSSEGEGEEPKK
jgi:hypothetical protein